MEMFEAFGFAERVRREAYWVNEVTFWKPDPDDPARILRHARVQDVEDGLSEFPHVILNQARIHDYFLEAMQNAPTRLTPDYGRALIGLDIPEGDGLVTARLQRGDGEIETVRARYVVGCDGARSAVRSAIGRNLSGDSANQAWGVMDVLAVTDFPDIRLKAAIQSASEGSALVIPREGGYLVRIYIELAKLPSNMRVSGLDLTAEKLVEAAQRIFQPFTLDVKEIVWWSAYEIGQRIADGFDDARDGGDPKVFIAGDACHTHSPKAGQGMNVSMQDAFNLAWKLAGVLRGTTKPEILRTYDAERRAVAQDLIDFDREWAAMFSARPSAKPGDDGVDPAEFQRYFVRQLRYTAGVETQYRPSLLSVGTAHQALATGFPVGRRFHSAPVMRLADGRPLELGHVARADGRWRLYLFADEKPVSDPASPLRALCAFLESDPASPLRVHTPDGAAPDSVIDVRAIFPGDWRDVSLERTPAILAPHKGRLGLRDYEKMFCADRRAGRDIFELRGIGRRGAVVAVRPDQYVAHVLPLDARAELTAFFAAILRACGGTPS